MNRKQKALLAAGLLAGTAALTGCTAMTMPAATPTPSAAQQVTAQPETAEATPAPSESPEAETSGPIALLVDGKSINANAMVEEDGIFLPLEATGKALGWDVAYEEAEEDALTRKSVKMEKDGSRITVTWTVSDNTARQITWQKDGLLIPVDTQITTADGVAYVPAAFFETAMRVRVDKDTESIRVSTPSPQETAPNDVEDAGSDVK